MTVDELLEVLQDRGYTVTVTALRTQSSPLFEPSPVHIAIVGKSARHERRYVKSVQHGLTELVEVTKEKP